jgi:hypothetical protein
MANHVLIVDPWWNVEIGRNINFISLQSRTKQLGELTVSGKNGK